MTVMVPASFTNFFIASAGAGGALIGLLFVAVSIAPESNIMEGAPIERQVVAASAFTSLLNAFFISLAALIPANLGGTVVAMSLVGLCSSLSFSRNLFKDSASWRIRLSRTVLLLVSVAIFVYEFYIAVVMILKPAGLSSYYVITTLLLCVYGLGLLRAWQLLGAQRYGLLSWLNPLKALDHEMAAKKAKETHNLQPSPVELIDQE